MHLFVIKTPPYRICGMSRVSGWFVHSVVCLTRRPQPLPKLLLHRVRSSTLSFNFQYLLSSLRSLSSCLRLLPRLQFFLLPFHQQRFVEAVPTQNMTSPVSLLSLFLCRMSIGYLILCNTSSFLTR